MRCEPFAVRVLSLGACVPQPLVKRMRLAPDHIAPYNHLLETTCRGPLFQCSHELPSHSLPSIGGPNDEPENFAAPTGLQQLLLRPVQPADDVTWCRLGHQHNVFVPRQQVPESSRESFLAYRVAQDPAEHRETGSISESCSPDGQSVGHGCLPT